VGIPSHLEYKEMMKPRFAIDYDKKRSIHNSKATLIGSLVGIECKSFYFSGGLGKEMETVARLDTENY
jgi:hypothetical protein